VAVSRTGGEPVEVARVPEDARTAPDAPEARTTEDVRSLADASVPEDGSGSPPDDVRTSEATRRLPDDGRPKDARAPAPSEDAEALNTRGKELLRAGRYQEAETAFRDAIAQRPSGRYLLNLCMAHHQQGELSDALGACRRAERSQESAQVAKVARALIDDHIAPKMREAGGDSAASSLSEAEAAAKAGRWPDALALAEKALVQVAPAMRPRAATVAALAACNTKDRAKVLRYVVSAPATSQRLIQERCRVKGISIPLPTEPGPPISPTDGER
jgi:tetratricopeptide (TPR) repeat protein